MEPAGSVDEPATVEYVILLHGLLRSRRSMGQLERRLTSRGYNVINVGYRSTKQSIESLVEESLGPVIASCCQSPGAKIHFVTHSIGGIVVRYYLKHHDLAELGRVVMLSPPNQGTELVDQWGSNYFLKVFNWPAGLQMGTGADGLPAKLGPVDFELGVIAGSQSLNPAASGLIPGPDDGVVSVERTKVAGMADFLVVPYSHTFIMTRETVIEQVIHFLEHGAFKTVAEH
ncbi:MAG: alpha/beta hydrolase [Fidelibacterota bacterium]|nr:MAG: alpha/beta hydrolase [Candidatus Neomarinimicrobiota bacterium]